MISKEQIKVPYQKAKVIIENAIESTNNLSLLEEEDRQVFVEINKTLIKVNEDFKKEIQELENDSEWDKFNVAFFGETNAGKSTFIEGLRIMCDEESRKLDQIKNREAFKDSLKQHLENLNNTMEAFSSMRKNLTQYINDYETERNKCINEVNSLSSELAKVKLDFDSERESLIKKADSLTNEVNKLQKELKQTRILALCAFVLCSGIIYYIK